MKYLITLISIVYSTVYSTTLFAGETVDKTLKAATSGKVVIKVVKGDVTVIAWDKPEVHVQGELDNGDNKFIFETRGDQTLIELEPEGKQQKHSWGSSSAEITVSVPAGTFLEAGGMSTDFMISGVQGSVRAESVSGDIELSNINADMTIETVSGDIDIEASQGKMRLSTVSGDIETEGNTDSLDVNTVSGDVEADIGEVTMVDYTSVSGDLELNFNFATKGQLEANTVSGDMNFEFSNKVLDARFDLETGPGGEIENRLSDAKSKEFFIGSEKLSFVLGKGQGSVEIETMSGTIELRDE